ncbi:MAG: RNA polymerase sigma factor [Bacteroidales bacterium]|nr:RNA polymerase sigma factor [Bacteroidales bacterium]
MTDKELIQKILMNDETSFKTLVEKYQTMVLNTCFSFLQDRADAEDITQEVFIEVFLSLHKFKKNAKLSTWIYRIAVNKSLNYLRDTRKTRIIKRIDMFFSKNKEEKLQIPDNSDTEKEVNEVYEYRLKQLYQAIDSLKRKQKIAFTLNKVQKLSYEQVAEIMGLSISAVEGLIHRAKINVQKEILKNLKKNQKD